MPQPANKALVRKSFALKVAELSENTIKGAASAIGNMDRGGDVICPGFFDGALEGFRKHGFVAVGHDWSGLPVAMPTKAVEQKGELYTEATYHSTVAGQEARTVAKERKDAGLDVGLSIGFSLRNDGFKMFRSGADLLAWLPENGYDLSDFDAGGITAWKGTCRALLKGGCHELYEYSIVTVPMNPEALASDAKGAKFWGSSAYNPSTGEYEESTAAAATVGALNALYYDLCDKVAATLWDKNSTRDERIATMEADFDRFNTQSKAVIGALLTILEATPTEEGKAAVLRSFAAKAAYLPSAALVANPAGATVPPTADPAADAAILRTMKNLACL